MKQIFFFIDTSLDEEAAAACGFVPDPAMPGAIPAPLRRIERGTMLIADCGSGATQTPHAFQIVSIARSDDVSEGMLIGYFDMLLYKTSAEPGTVQYSYDGMGQAMFYRGLRHQVQLLSFHGINSERGRVLSLPISPVAAQGEPPATHALQCAGLGIPLCEAIDAISGTAPESVETLAAKLAEIQVCAGWLLVMMLANPLDPERVHTAWDRLAAWIEDDPDRQHLLPFAKAGIARSKFPHAPDDAGAASHDGDAPGAQPA